MIISDDLKSVSYQIIENINKHEKGTRWMPRRKKAMKDVESCDKPREAAEQAMIRGFPNGTTHPEVNSGYGRMNS